MSYPDQPYMWENQKKGSFEELWSSTVLPWQLTAPWQWETTPNDINNKYQH